MVISEAVVKAFKEAPTPHGWKGDELIRSRLEAAFAQARREIAHQALKPERRHSTDLVVRAERFMRQCGRCDYGLPEYACSCQDEDYRGLVVDLVTEIERLRGILWET